MHKIMCVDDEPGILQALKWVFADEPYELFLFQSPLDALDALKIHEFAVVLSDLNMPGMIGIEF